MSRACGSEPSEKESWRVVRRPPCPPRRRCAPTLVALRHRPKLGGALALHEELAPAASTACERSASIATAEGADRACPVKLRRVSATRKGRASASSSAQLQLLRAGSTARACSADVSRAHTARLRSDTVPRVVPLQSYAASGPRFRSFRAASIPPLHCSISIAACVSRARTQTCVNGVKFGHPQRTCILQETACIATAQPGPSRCNLPLGCIADIPAALQ